MPAPNPRNSVPLTESQKALAGEHYRLPYWYARKMTRALACPEYVEQATDSANLALIRAARDFEPEKGSKFSHMAGHYIRRAILSRLNGERRKRRCFLGLGTIHENDDPPIDGRLPDFEPDFEDLLQVLDDAPSHQRVVELRYRDGLTFDEIGARLDVSKQRAHQMLANAIDLFRRRMKA